MASSDFDDFDDFDKMFDEIDGDVFTSSKKRRPISYFREGFLSGLKDTLKETMTDEYTQKYFFKEAGLRGFGNTSSVINKGIKEANNLYNEASEQLKNPLKGLVKELDSRIPENKTFLKKLSAKAKSILGVDEDSEYQSKSKEQLEQEGIQNTLEETFGKNTLMTEAANNARFQAQFKQSGLGNKLLGNVNLGIQSLVRYQNTIDVNYKKKSLEVQLKSLFVQKKQLEVVTQMLGSIINQNKAIQLNTSLPDQDKIMHSKHANKHLLSKNILKHSYNLFSNSEYIKRLKTNLRNTIKNHIENASMGLDTVNSGLEMSRDMGMNPFMALGMGAAGMLPIDDVIQGVVAPWLKKKIKPGGKISKLNSHLEKYTTDLEGGGNALIDKLRSKFRVDSDERFGGNGLKTALKDLVYDTLGGMKTSKTDWYLDKKDNGSNLFNPVPFNLQTQKSINLIIPGYLARILQQVTQNNLNHPGLGKAKAPLLNFSHDKNKFTDNKRMVGQAAFKMDQVLQTKYSRKYISDIVDKTFQGKNLNDNQKQLLRTHITQGMFNGSLGDRDYLLNEDFHKSLSATDSAAIKKAVGESLNTDDNNIQFLRKFSYAKNQIGDPRAFIERMINEGREEDLIKAGYIRRTRFGYKVNQNKIIDQLARGKGVDKPEAPETAMGNLIKATNSALNNTTQTLYTQATAKAAPYVQRAQSIVEPYTHVIGNHVQNKISDVLNSLPKKYNDEVLKIEQLYAEHTASPNNQKLINRYNSSVVSFKGKLDKLRKQYKNNPTVLSSINKLDSYFKPIQSPIQGSQSEGGFIHIGMPSVTEDSIIGRAKRFFNRKPNESNMDSQKVDLGTSIYGKESTYTENTNTGQVEHKGPKKHKEESIMSILTKFYNKFKDYSESIEDVRVVSDEAYDKIKKDGTYKKVRKRKGLIGRTIDKATRPFSGIGDKLKSAFYHTPLDKLHALKTLIPIETLSKIMSIPKSVVSTFYNGTTSVLRGVKKAVGWVNPLTAVIGGVRGLHNLARTGSNLINGIGCTAEDLYKVTDNKGGLSAEPILTKYGFVNGEYFNANGKVIHTTCDIKGNVYDANQNVLVTAQYIKEYGLFNKKGKKVNTKGLISRMIGKVASGLWHIPSTILRQSGKLLSAPAHVAGFLAKNAGSFLSHLFSGFGFAGGVAKSGMNLMSSILKPFGHIGKLFRDPYTEKSYKVLIDIRKLLINKLNGGSWHGYNQGVSMLNGKIIPGVRTELDDPTAQVFADRWWKHPGQSIKNKYNNTKGKLSAYLAKKHKAKDKSKGGLLSDALHLLTHGGMLSDLAKGAGVLGALGYAKRKVGSVARGVFKYGKKGVGKVGDLWKALKGKLGLGGEAAGDATGDAVADVAGDAAVDGGLDMGVEATGTALDATGIGAPVGLLLNAAGGLMMVYQLFHKQINSILGWGLKKVEKAGSWVAKKATKVWDAIRHSGLYKAGKDVVDADVDAWKWTGKLANKGDEYLSDWISGGHNYSLTGALGYDAKRVGTAVMHGYDDVKSDAKSAVHWASKKWTTITTDFENTVTFINKQLSGLGSAVSGAAEWMYKNIPGLKPLVKGAEAAYKDAKKDIKTAAHTVATDASDAWNDAKSWVTGKAKKVAKGVASLADGHPKGYFTHNRRSTHAPLGIKNNNPGMITLWVEDKKLPIVKGYVKFNSAKQGLEAFAETIKYYIVKGQNTLPSLLKALALPAFVSSPSEFLSSVETYSKYTANSKLNPDSVTLNLLLSSIIRTQYGSEYYNPSMYEEAAKSAASADVLKHVVAAKLSTIKGSNVPKPASNKTKSQSSSGPAKVGKSKLSFGQALEKGVTGMITGAIAGIFGLSTSIFKGIGKAAVSAYNGVKYVGGKIAHYTLKGFKELEGDFASVVKLVSFYGLSGLTAFLESRGDPAVISSGVGDHGGASYGTFQLSSLTGGVQGFLGYIQNTDLGKKLINSGAVDSAGFKAMWKKLATTEPKFNHMQAEYNKVNYYDPIMHQLAQNGCDLSDKKLGTQCVLDRTANQFGAGGGANLVLTALHGKDVSKLSSDDVIKLIEDHKLNNINGFFSGCSPSERQGVARELLMEKKFGIKLNGATVQISGKAVNKAPPKTKKVTNVKGKVNQKAVNKKPVSKTNKAPVKKTDTQSKALTTTSTKQPIAKIHTGFTGPAKTTPVTHPVVMTTNHQDVKDIHSHVADIHTLLQKSVEIQTKIYDELKNTNVNKDTKSKNYNSELQAEQSVLGDPRNASPGNKNRKPTNVPSPVVSISRNSLSSSANKDW